MSVRDDGYANQFGLHAIVIKYLGTSVGTLNL